MHRNLLVFIISTLFCLSRFSLASDHNFQSSFFEHLLPQALLPIVSANPLFFMSESAPKPKLTASEKKLNPHLEKRPKLKNGPRGQAPSFQNAQPRFGSRKLSKEIAQQESHVRKEEFEAMSYEEKERYINKTLKDKKFLGSYLRLTGQSKSPKKPWQMNIRLGDDDATCFSQENTSREELKKEEPEKSYAEEKYDDYYEDYNSERSSTSSSTNDDMQEDSSDSPRDQESSEDSNISEYEDPYYDSCFHCYSQIDKVDDFLPTDEEDKFLLVYDNRQQMNNNQREEALRIKKFKQQRLRDSMLEVLAEAGCYFSGDKDDKTFDNTLMSQD